VDRLGDRKGRQVECWGWSVTVGLYRAIAVHVV
jgi:hypothetical protein